ncbi:MAG: hypothetical protein ACOY33_00035 [Pseudomonadota bacterium]
MRKNFRGFMAALFVLGSATGPTNAATVMTYTGVDLLDVAGMNVTPSEEGTSLVFSPSGSSVQRLFTLPLGSLPDGKVKVLIHMTNPGCIGSCTGGNGDFDPGIAIGNGTTMVGVVVSDNSGAVAADFADVYGTVYRSLNGSLFAGTGFPGVGETLVVTLEVEIGMSTTEVSVETLGDADSYTKNFALSPGTNGYELVFLQDNDSGENYTVNAVTVVTGSCD